MPTQINFNQWIPIEFSPNVITKVQQNSAVMAHGQQIPMGTESRSTPRSGGVQMGSIAKGGTYQADTASIHDAVWLYVSKFGSVLPLAEEDMNDSLADIVNTKNSDAGTSFAKLFDNACLGVTAQKDGQQNQFDSLYYLLSQNDSATGYVGGTNINVATSAGITYDLLSASLGQVEQSDYYEEGDLVTIAHPSFRQVLRGIKDGQGRPIFNESTAGFPGGGQSGSLSLFGHQLMWSLGARQSATPTPTPTGKPLIITCNRRYMLVGNRFPLSVQAIDGKTGLGALTDTAYLKYSARKAFAVGHENAFSMVVSN